MITRRRPEPQFSSAAVTIGIMVLFLGRRLNAPLDSCGNSVFLKPCRVASWFPCLMALVYLTTRVEIQFDLAARDTLLVYFFTTIGINSSLKDLAKGGKPFGHIAGDYHWLHVPAEFDRNCWGQAEAAFRKQLE